MNFNYNTNASNIGVQNNATNIAANSSANRAAAVPLQTTDTTINTDKLKSLDKDTITLFGKDVNKKKAIIFGIGSLAAITGTVAAIIYAIKHNKNLSSILPENNHAATLLGGGKTRSVSENAELLQGKPNEIISAEVKAKKFIDNSKKMMERSKECKQRALKTNQNVENTINDVQQLFDSKARKTADGRKIEIANGIMKEFAADDITIKRMSTFDGKTPKTIEEFIDSTKKNVIEFNADKKTITYKENLIQKGAESTHDKEVLLYKGKLNRYIEGIKEYADGSATYEKMVDFNMSGKMETYAEKCKYSNIDEKFAKILDFEINRESPNEYAEEFVKHINGKETFRQNLSFIPGVSNPNAYTEGHEKLADGSTKSKINVLFNKKGVIMGYEENSIDGIEKKWDKCFKYSHEQWYSEPSPK